MTRSLKDIDDSSSVVDEVADQPFFARAFGAKKGKYSPQPLGTVGASVEFRRIEALPRRVLDLKTVQDLTPLFRKKGGTWSLLPIQSAALIEAAMNNGMFGSIQIGGGKTLISLLLPTALDSERAVLLVPAALKKKTLREIDQVYSKHFILPLDILTIVSYEELSSPDGEDDVLQRLKPDLIIADEAHRLRHYRKSARGKRWDAYMKDFPGTRFAPMSGGISSRSPIDCGHLAEAALKKGSPYPRGYQDLKDWDGAIGVKPEYVMRPGALLRFCQGDETVRQGFQRRVNETPGVVATTEMSCQVALNIRRVSIKIPKRVQDVISEVEKKWAIEGVEFDDALTKASIMRQLACGFYYRWAWPGGEPDWEWLDARNAWNKAVREKLKNSREGMDSPARLARAAERYFKGKRDGLIWNASEWIAWRELKDRQEPPKEAVWLDSFLCEDALARAKKSEAPTLVWYGYRAVGSKLGELSGLPVYGQGTDPTGTKHDICIVSIKAQHEGKNLQDHYASNIITSLPSSGDIVEQLIGRTHRDGQERDEVWVDWYGHTPECLGAMASVQSDALYKWADGEGQPQRVLYATHVNEEH